MVKFYDIIIKVCVNNEKEEAKHLRTSAFMVEIIEIDFW